MFADLQEKLSELIRGAVGRVLTILAPYVKQAQTQYQKLERRERIMVTIAACLLGFVVLYEFVYLPVVDFGGDVQDQIAERQHELTQVRGAVQTYLRLQAALADAKHHTPEGPEFSLFSIVETALTRSVGRDKLSSVTPAADRKLSDKIVQHSVDLQLTNLSLGQVVDALYSLRALSVPIAISQLHIKRRQQNSHTYDVDMICTAVGRNG
jgi:type II secretory pathway component PulM